VTLTGAADEKLYLKGLLDRIGIVPQFVSVGRFKSAMETYERSGPSEGDREQMRSMLESSWTRILDTLARDRKLPLASIEAAFRAGVFTPTRALELGFIDELAQHDQIKPLLDRFLAREIAPVAALQLGSRELAWAAPEVAVLAIQGGISQGMGGRDLLQGDSVGADPIGFAARRLAEDGSIAAVVLRIDSPGGDAFASDVIRRDLELLARRKPVVVSMGNVAASGGYWVAMLPGVKVFADPDTITGSIGVIIHAQDVSGLMVKLGVKPTTIQSGANKDILSPYRAMRPDERALLQGMVDDIYQQFLEAIVAGRGMPLARLKPLADGRVYTGRQAKANGLVDELGTSQDAIRWLARTAKLGDEPRLKNYTESNFLDQVLPGVSSRFGGLAWSAGLESLLRLDRVPLALME
jgi:protease-4